MTMFSAVNRRRFCELGFDVMSQLNGTFTSFSTSTGGGGSDPLINNKNTNNSNIVGPILMADDDELRNESPAESSSKCHNIVPGDDDDDDADDADDDDGQEWLQLGIGGHGGQPAVKQEDLVAHDHEKITTASNSSANLVELELMPSSGSNIISNDHNNNNNNNNNSDSQILGRIPEFRAPRPVTTFSPYLLQQHHHHHYNPAGMTNFVPHHHNQEINWALIRPIPISIAAAAAASSSSGSYFQGVYGAGGGVDNMGQRGPPGLDFRVIQPPRRPHSGVWFMLQASQNQEKEPFLPQISRSYLRIKDGRMAIRLVIKYLANKLRLENESEIELRCKGQRLLPFLTLQHVRDNIWSNPRDFITLLPNSSTTHHIMVLHYARTASN